MTFLFFLIIVLLCTNLWLVTGKSGAILGNQEDIYKLLKQIAKKLNIEVKE